MGDVTYEGAVEDGITTTATTTTTAIGLQGKELRGQICRRVGHRPLQQKENRAGRSVKRQEIFSDFKYLTSRWSHPERQSHGN